MCLKRSLLTLTMVALVFLHLPPAAAQSTTSGDIAGVVTDPSGAILPNINVTLKSVSTGSTQTRTTNAQGMYRFSLLPPGDYKIAVSAPNFQQTERAVAVTTGQTTTLNIQLALGTASETIEVTAEQSGVQTENANVSTSFSAEQVAQVPNPGNDLSYIVQTAPGAVMNTQAGYGNASTFGLPATSNLFTINGMNENDPFFNLNNSGATNLLLGQNDVHEVTVVNNGYSGQYGGLAGANVNYVTKAGTNQWHGNANYFWNGRTMNANNFFNNQSDTPRPFVNANQWAASIGGPIRKDKTFFFVNTEGLRVVLPTSTLVRIPSPEFEQATLANLGSDPAAVSFYTQMFNLYNNAPGANRATAPSSTSADPTGCAGFVGPNGLGTTVPCALQFRSIAGNQTNEWLLSARVDQNLGNNDRVYVHFRTDHGLQATYTDPINSAFNAQSDQPQYEGQLNETHTFGANAVNQFILSGSWYSALFSPENLNAATQLMPFRLRFSGDTFFSLGRFLNDWPQGRNSTQYQAVDDFSWLKGKHALKFGVNFHRNDVTDFDPGLGSIGFSLGEDLDSFFNGQGNTFIQNFPQRLSQPVAVYGLGFYAQDEWAVKPNLKITLALRADHNSNPVCQTNCFARLSDSFLSVSHDPNQPYNQAIMTNLHQALGSFDAVNWQPRFGFAWTPFHSHDGTVIRGGFGLFTDLFPSTVADSFMNNSPLNNQFVAGAAPLTPGDAGSQSSLVSQANASFLAAFSNGQTLNDILATNPLFVPPSLFNAARHIHSPRYQEWNLELQQQLGRASSLSLNYVGNHGIHEAIQNAGLNAFCDAVNCAPLLGVTSFTGLPAAPLDQRFGTITEVSSAGVSNYNGLTVSFRRRFASLQMQANYTWSHALDEISNAGFLQYNFATNESTLNPQDPFNLRKYNYGNADYDTRHYFSLNYVWDVPYRWGPKAALDGWVLSGTIFARSGLPFTVVDSNAAGILNSFNYGTTAGVNVFANALGGAPTSCSSDATNPSKPCLLAADFAPVTGSFGNQRRNQFYGPKYFDTDLSVMKNFHIPHWEGAKLGLGAQFFNLFNHPNFDQPIADIQDPQFGTITATVNTPTSILGSFLGGDASPRLIQLRATLNF